MALKISMKSIYGINAEYWKVGNVVIDRDRKIARIIMHGYPTKDIREGDNQPLMKLTVNVLFDKFEEVFSISNLDREGNNPIKLAYEYVKKEDDFFKEAENILEEDTINE